MESPSTDAAERFVCAHGGPGEIEASKKAVFVESCNVTTGKVHKALLLRAPRQELIAAELIAVEEMISSSEGIRSMVDDSLMRFYFALATSDPSSPCRPSEHVFYHELKSADSSLRRLPPHARH